MDRLLRLGPPLVQQARDEMKRVEEECAVSYITSSVAPRLQPLSLAQLDTLAEAALVVPSLDALLASLNEIEVEHGRAEGLIDGLALALELKFGAAAAPVIAEVRQISDLAQIEAIMAKIKSAESLDEVRSVYSPPPEI